MMNWRYVIGLTLIFILSVTFWACWFGWRLELETR